MNNFKEHLAEARVAPTPATQKKLTRPLDRSAGAALKRSLNLSVDGLDDLAWKLEYQYKGCLLYTSPSPRDKRQSRMPSSA